MSINTERRKEVFSDLGNILRDYTDHQKNSDARTNIKFRKFSRKLSEGIKKTKIENPWFTEEFQLINLAGWGELLRMENLTDWLSGYPEGEFIEGNRKRIGLVLAGNIPLVGFHDILCVLMSGHFAVTKLSSKDRVMYPILKEILTDIEPSIGNQWIIRENERLNDVDAVIATGSDNSSRYFEYYFGKYPNIIRKNRNSIAVLTGNETEKEMKALADDIFLYFGLGCRSISKLYVPENFTPEQFYPYMEHYAYLYNHTKYANNYDYQRAVHLVNKLPIYDNGFLILKNDQALFSPVGCLFYEKYASENLLSEKIEHQKEKIQCVVTTLDKFPGKVNFGSSQFPALDEYADNIDSLKFLFNLYKN